MQTDIPFFQVDAFASAAFEGNQACVMPLDDGFLDDETLQKIAAENNVAETAFIVSAGEGTWELRWFTPAVEVPLCGHATLAAGHVLLNEVGADDEKIIFRTRQSGDLVVARQGAGYAMDFPAPAVFETEATPDIIAALGDEPIRCWGGPFFAAQFKSVADVKRLSPDVRALAKLGVSGHEGTWDRGNFGCFALGGEGDVEVTSRFFAPGSGIDEDPATGSWHCMLAVIASQLTGQPAHRCYQAFPSRGARIGVEVKGTRIELLGEAITVIRGAFTLSA
ncbi:MAG: PhzF family phenazine biosynthesis protein [Pseudomonadota bacterium]